jgi:hypothetical protein
MRTRLAVIVVAIYLAMAVAAAFVATLGKFGGIYLVALTMPWSLGGVLLLDAIDPKLLDNVIWGIGISCIGVAINSLVLYRVVRGRRADDSKPIHADGLTR